MMITSRKNGTRVGRMRVTPVPWQDMQRLFCTTVMSSTSSPRAPRSANMFTSSLARVSTTTCDSPCVTGAAGAAAAPPEAPPPAAVAESDSLVDIAAVT